MFWPSFNSALLEDADKRKAVLNTYYALAVSTVTAILMSSLAHPQGKINMVRRGAVPWATLGSSRPDTHSHSLASILGAFTHVHWAQSFTYGNSHNSYNSRNSSVQFSRSVVSDSLPPHESQHSRPPCPSPAPRVYSDSCPSSWRCHPSISSSVIPFSSCPQFLQASGSFPISQLFAVSASASVLPMNTQD